MMKNLEYYVSSAELGKEFSQILGITVKCWLACEHCTVIHRKQCLFLWWKLVRMGKGQRGEVPIRLTDGGYCV